MTSQQRIGQYRIVRKIGAGGMGMVFAGEHLLLGRRAAIKTLLPSLSTQPEIVERFFNEARATSAIADPGIVQVFDFGYHVDGTPYIVMELLEGESLISRIERLKVLPMSSALRIARQVASSLAAAHARDIVHRDLKPENIFLIGDREAQGGERTKVLDFGICKVREGTDGEHAVFGTPVYMSPEQCRGAGFVDHRTDVYALGCVLFEMLTGRAPFERETAEELVVAHQSEVPPPASALVGGIPPAVDALLQRCLAKSPDERYPSMTALGEAIEDLLARCSAPPPAVSEARGTPALPVTVALGGGFRSGPGGNAGARSGDAAKASSEAVPRRSRLRRAAVGMALLAAAITASIVTRLTGGEAAIAAATGTGGGVGPAAVMPVLPPALPPAVAPARVPAADPEPRGAASPPPQPPQSPRSPPPQAAPSPSRPPRLASPPRPPRRAPASRASTPPSPALAPAEDLYDTR